MGTAPGATCAAGTWRLPPRRSSGAPCTAPHARSRALIPSQPLPLGLLEAAWRRQDVRGGQPGAARSGPRGRPAPALSCLPARALHPEPPPPANAAPQLTRRPEHSIRAAGPARAGGQCRVACWRRRQRRLRACATPSPHKSRRRGHHSSQAQTQTAAPSSPGCRPAGARRAGRRSRQLVESGTRACGLQQDRFKTLTQRSPGSAAAAARQPPPRLRTSSGTPSGRRVTGCPAAASAASLSTSRPLVRPSRVNSGAWCSPSTCRGRVGGWEQ